MSGRSSCISWAVPERAFGLKALANEGNDPNRAAGTTFNLHRQGKDQGAGRWQAVQICQIFESADVSSRGDAMHNKVLRLTKVDGCRIHAENCNLSFFDKQASRVLAIRWELKIAGVARCVIAQVGFSVWPVLAPTGAQQHDISGFDATVSIFE